MGFVFSPPHVVAIPVRSSDDLLPVRRIYCVGRNYAEHSIEMGHDPSRETPFFFQKNPDCVVLDGIVPYPSGTKDVHHEVELVVALQEGGDNITVEQALGCVFGYSVGLDLTRRDLQAEAKKAGRPWEIAKAFENSAPLGTIVPAEQIGHPDRGAIWLKVNGTERQRGDLNQMIWKVAETISYLSGLFRLAPGDLIMTGTPAGVGPIARGDHLHAGIEGVGELQLRVV